jgi:hypothetical protein
MNRPFKCYCAGMQILLTALLLLTTPPSPGGIGGVFIQPEGLHGAANPRTVIAGACDGVEYALAIGYGSVTVSAGGKTYTAERRVVEALIAPRRHRALSLSCIGRTTAVFQLAEAYDELGRLHYVVGKLTVSPQGIRSYAAHEETPENFWAVVNGRAPD